MLTPGALPSSEKGIGIQTNTDKSRELFGDYHGAMNSLHDLITEGYHSGETMMDDVPIYCAVYMPELGKPKGKFKETLEEVSGNFFMSPEELRISVQRVKRHVEKRMGKSKRFAKKFNELKTQLETTSSQYQDLNPVH